MTRPVEPQEVVNLVEQFVDKTLRDAAEYINNEPLDESNVYSLHLLASEIYALGFNDGAMADAIRSQRQISRSREKAPS